jgi:uncharacterized membrane protein
MNFNTVEENAFKATLKLINIAEVRVNSSSLKNALSTHHDFPSLASLSEVLEEFNVPNLATKLHPDQLSQIPLPAIAHLSIEDGSFVVITKISEHFIEYQHNTLGKKHELLSNFYQKWDGVTLLIEPNEKSGESDYQAIKRKNLLSSLRISFAIIGLLTCIFYLLYPIIESNDVSQNWQFYGLIISKFTGLILSCLLIWYSLDANISFLNKVCQLNKKTNCQDILSSKAASIGGIISWSEIGFIYFLGGFLSLVFFQQSLIPILQIINLLALPYTFWSIYHQAFKAKIWCPLCLGVQALLWTEFFITLPIIIKSDTIENYSAVGICFLFAATLIASLMNPIKDSFQKERLSIEFQKLKFNPDFVLSILSKEVFLPPFDHQMQMIEIGSPEAETVFQIVINPVCGACRQKFLDMMEIVENNDEVKYQLILSSSSKQDEVSNQIVKTILGLANNSLMIEALYKWFLDENQNFEVWKNAIKTTENNIKGENQRLLHRQWLDEANITHVPLTYLNNVEIPTLYSTKEAVKLLKHYSNVGFRNQ